MKNENLDIWIEVSVQCGLGEREGSGLPHVISRNTQDISFFEICLGRILPLNLTLMVVITALTLFTPIKVQMKCFFYC